MTFNTSPQPKAAEAVYNLCSVFDARRDLRPASKALMHGTTLRVDEFDILILLYGHRRLGWADCRVYDDGYVNFADLKFLTVHDPGLFTRRISSLRKRKLVSVRSGRESVPSLHAKAQQARIDDAGIVAVKPIWEQYSQFAAELLKDISKRDLEAHRRVNEIISQKLRERRDPAKYILGLVD